MKSYAIYGLGIHSTFDLPAAPLVAGAIHVEVRRAHVDLPAAMGNGCIRSCENEALLVWPDAGNFLVRGGREILVDTCPDADPVYVGHLLVGAALAVVLHQRGRLVLHASAVSIGDKIIAFLGPSGGGKSTIAAALNARGHCFITDDVLVVDATASEPVAYAGYPGFKLWPNAVDVLNHDFELQGSVHPRLEKRVYTATDAFACESLPLRCIYALAEGEDPRTEAIESRAAFVELLRHTYTARVVPTCQTAAHFTQCARIASEVPVRRLVVPRSPQHLVAAADLIEADLAVA